MNAETVIAQITAAFRENTYPGDAYLLGSKEGCEPFEEVEPFYGRTDWQAVPSDFLDAHGGALSFFTETGFRFYLPAYLIADISGALQYADPLFHVTHGFRDFSIDLEKAGRVFHITSGKTHLVNPRRYGAMTSEDYARYRLSVFTREEAAAIVAYLNFKREDADNDFEHEYIDAALTLFWHDRAQSAPMRAMLQQHIADEEAYVRAIREERGET